MQVGEFASIKDNKQLKKYKSNVFRTAKARVLIKYVYLCSPIIGERLRIPVNQGVNSGVFGRAQWFVNRWFIRGIVWFQHSLDLQPGLDSR